jgi:hypothetical protein
MSEIIPEDFLETKPETPQTEEVPPSRLQASFNEFIKVLQEETIAPLVEKVSQKFNQEWETIDASWTEKYGDNYQQLKQYLQTAKTRYDEEKSRIEVGEPTPVERQQSDWTINFAEAGVWVAKAEERIKQRLQELWENRKIGV